MINEATTLREAMETGSWLHIMVTHMASFRDYLSWFVHWTSEVPNC